jgi:hypothetical protein
VQSQLSPEFAELLKNPGAKVMVSYINPSNLKVLGISKVLPRTRESALAASRGDEFLNQQMVRLGTRVRQVLQRYHVVNGIPQVHFFVAYSITHGSSFGCDAQCLGYSVYDFEATVAKIYGVILSQVEVEVWEKAKDVLSSSQGSHSFPSFQHKAWFND